MTHAQLGWILAAMLFSTYANLILLRDIADVLREIRDALKERKP